jgi:hypothetical protein
MLNLDSTICNSLFKILYPTKKDGQFNAQHSTSCER